MAPHSEVENEEDIVRLPAPEKPQMSKSPPRLIIIGAGSRGNAYARALGEATNGICAAVVEPIAYKRQALGRSYIWGDKGQPTDGQEFEDWKDFVVWEEARRVKHTAGEEVPEGVDGAFICVQDELHKSVILGLEKLNIHIMCEKPLATTLNDCIDIYKSLLPSDPSKPPERLFSIGHVLRYSPHNMLLRKLLLEDKVIGDVLSVNHTEPVGWWHFSHSYVRGNWRKESTSAPSLLTKSCHDIDVLLWLLSSPPPNSPLPRHLPSSVSSLGARQFFNKHRKPAAAGSATNCLSCPHEPDCMFSAKKIYTGSELRGLGSGNTGWPVKIVVPDIEDYLAKGGQAAGEAAILKELAADYDADTPADEISKQNWFGRCVWESDNDVCDDQVVTMTWDNDDNASAGDGRGPKIAQFHMVAFTAKICQRYTHIYGTTGEVYADSDCITVTDFRKPTRILDAGKEAAFESKKYYPHLAGGGHGGGDAGLARQFVLAIDRVKRGDDLVTAQKEELGCTIDEIVTSHAVVFAAEEARRNKVVLDFPEWWKREVALK
ncbi:hypothetical protein VE03_04441 [Pseudogymnoascus sp. 23342-1-I1]|nr:hypothetical protein VE03_04441 [Pseudogymnoascus sp. 23342-1-I1]